MPSNIHFQCTQEGNGNPYDFFWACVSPQTTAWMFFDRTGIPSEIRRDSSLMVRDLRRYNKDDLVRIHLRMIRLGYMFKMGIIGTRANAQTRDNQDYVLIYSHANGHELSYIKAESPVSGMAVYKWWNDGRFSKTRLTTFLEAKMMNKVDAHF